MSEKEILNNESSEHNLDGDNSQCKECIKLQNELESSHQKVQQLEEINDNLTKQIEGLLLDHESHTKQIEALKVENDEAKAKEEESKKQSLLQNIGTGLLAGNSLSQSEVVGASTEDLTGNTSGLNLKKLQQDLRVSKKAEQLAKEKLAATKKTLERTERDFTKHKEDAQSRIDQLSNEIQILQKHYDQLQNSINENELEMRSNGSQSNKGNELMKIIEEYSRQNDLKAKEIEQMVAKLDRKALKMDSLKKVKSESEAKNIKLRSTLDNVKTFLRLLSNNYMKSIKVQVFTLKEQYQALTDDFKREIGEIKSQIEPQITKIVQRQNSDILSKIQSERDKIIQLVEQVKNLSIEHKTQLEQLQKAHDDEMASIQLKNSEKINRLKEKMRVLNESAQAFGNEKTQIKDTLTARIIELEKDMQLANLKLESEKDKFQIKVQEQNRDIQQRDQLISDLKQSQAQYVEKFEQMETKFRQEIQIMIQKHENEKLAWLQRESDVSGARESERLKEIRELMESKSKEKDEEIQKMKIFIQKAEEELIQLKEGEKRKIEQLTESRIQLQDSQKQIELLKVQVEKKQASSIEKKKLIAELQQKLVQSDATIKDLTFKGQRQDEQLDSIQKHQVEQLKSKIEDLIEQLKMKQEKIEALENTIDQIKFDNYDEINSKEQIIRELNEQIRVLGKELKDSREESLNELKRKEEIIISISLTNESLKNENEVLIVDMQKIQEELKQFKENQSEIKISESQIIVQQDVEIAQQVNQAAPKKKRIVKKKKHYDAEVQTLEEQNDQLNQKMSEQADITNLLQQDSVNQISIISNQESIQVKAVSREFKQIQRPNQELEINGIVEDKQAPKPDLDKQQLFEGGSDQGSPKLIASHIEEDSYTAVRQEESIEKRVHFRNDQPDMAMRGPAPGAPRFGAPRPGFQAAGGPQNMRGRGFQARPLNPAGRGIAPIYRATQPQQQQQLISQANENQEVNTREQPLSDQHNNNSILGSIEEVKTQSRNQEVEEEIKVERIKQHTTVMNPSRLDNQVEEQKDIQKQEIAKDMPSQLASSDLNKQQIEAKASQPVIEEQPIRQDIKQREEESKVKQVESVKAPEALPQPGQQQQASFLGLGNNRLVGMINGLLSMLTRKKAFTGRPASAMRWDEKKKRYIIDGDDESDEDIPPPPPPRPSGQQPVDQNVQANEQKQSYQAASSQKSEDSKSNVQATEASSANDLTRPAMPSHFGARGRGRGASRGGASLNRFPPTFAPSQIQEAQKPQSIENQDRNGQSNSLETLQTSRVVEAQNLMEEEKIQLNANNQSRDVQVLDQSLCNTSPRNDAGFKDDQSGLYTTTLDITMNQTSQLRDSIQILPDRDQQQVQQQLQRVQEPAFDEARESLWQEKFSSQQDKINNLKYKVQMLQQELRMQRSQIEENEQTIESFTNLCQDLKFKGMDEVEDLQSEIAIIKDHLKRVTLAKADFEIRSIQSQDALIWFGRENNDLRDRLQGAQNKVFDLVAQLEKKESELRLANLNLENQANQDEHESHEQAQIVLELQSELSKLKWERGLAEVERINKQIEFRETTQQMEALKAKIKEFDSERQTFLEDQRRNFNDTLIQHQDQVNKLEREKDTLREMIQRVQSEKERLSDQQRDRFTDFDVKLKQVEDLRLKSEQEAAKAIRERDLQIEQLRTKMNQVSQNAQLKDSEISQQRETIARLDAKVQQLAQKRQVESEMADNVMKSQLKQIQDLLQQKTQEVQVYESKQSEFTQELQNMDSLRHKLTENIIYLQNEIRKRDELLESSDFGDFDYVGGDDEQSESNIGGEDDDRVSQSQAQSVRGLDGQEEDAAVGGAAVNTSPSIRNQMQQVRKRKRRTLGQQLQNQIDETRGQLKLQIEEKMRAQRAFYNLERNYQKLAESLQDINQLLDQQQLNQGVPSVNNEQSSMAAAAEEETKSASYNQDLSSSYMLRNEDSLIQRGAQMDDLQHQIIQKIFTLSRHFESEMSEQQHKLKLMQMKLDESETLKFDLEFLTEEKALNENEIQQFKLTVRELEYKISELKQQLSVKNRSEEELRTLIAQERQKLNSQRQAEREQYEKQLRDLQTDNQAKIDEIHQTFKQQLLPQIKAKHEAKYQHIQDQLAQVKESLTSQLEEQRRLNETLEESQKSLLHQTQLIQETEHEEKQRLLDKISYLEISNQQAQNKLSQQQSSFEKTMSELEAERESLRLEKDLSESQFNQFKENLESYYKEAALKLKEKYDNEKRKNKDLKQKFKEQLERTLSQQQEEFSTSFNQEKETYESQISTLQSELEQVKQSQSEERENLALKMVSLQSRVNQLQTQIQSSTKSDDDLKLTLQESQANQESLQQYLSLAEEKIKTLDSEKNQIMADYSKEKENSIKKISVLENQILALEGKLSDLQTDNQNSQEEDRQIIESLRKEIEELKALNTKNAQDEKDSHNSEDKELIKELQIQVESLERQRIEEVQNVQNIARTVKQQLADQNQSLQSEIEDLKDQLRQKEKESSVKGGEQESEQIQDSNSKEILKLQEQIENLQEIKRDLESKHEKLLEELNNKLVTIEELKQKSEGYLLQIDEYKEAQTQLISLQQLLDEKEKALEILRMKQVESNQAEIQQAKSNLKIEWEQKLAAKETDHQQEIQDLLQYYNSREEDLKAQAVQAAEKLKADLKKQKEKVKSVLVALEQIQEEREGLCSKLKDLESQVTSQTTKVDALISENEVINQKLIEKENEGEKQAMKIQNLEQNLEQRVLELNEVKETLERLIQESNFSFEKLQQILRDHSLVDFDQQPPYVWEHLYEKIKETLSNYEEDKRSIKALIDEKENLQLLKDQYYTEMESISQEKSVLQEKFENTNAFKLQQKVQMLEEERSEMKSDFYIKINSYVQEIDSLKMKISRYEENEESKVGQQENSEVGLDKSKQISTSNLQEQKRRLTPQEANQTLLNEISRASGQLGQDDPSFMDQSKTSAIDRKKKEFEMNTSASQQQKSGLFNSIASFFLTDSELN